MPETGLGPDEQEFVRERDGFYMASVSETGWPYVQYRGGEKGFLRVLDAQTLGFADLRGNKQYISVGNLQHDDRVTLFLMDYRAQNRLKILGRARVYEGDAEARAADRKAARAGRKDPGRARRPDPCGSLRLELPAAHHPALHPGRDGRDARPYAAPPGHPRSRKQAPPGRGGMTERLCGIDACQLDIALRPGQSLQFGCHFAMIQRCVQGKSLDRHKHHGFWALSGWTAATSRCCPSGNGVPRKAGLAEAVGDEE